MKALSNYIAKVTVCILAAGIVLSCVSPVHASGQITIEQEPQQKEVLAAPELLLDQKQETTPPTQQETLLPETEKSQAVPALDDASDKDTNKGEIDIPSIPDTSLVTEDGEDTPLSPAEDTLPAPTDNTSYEPAESTPPATIEDVPSAPSEDMSSAPIEENLSAPEEVEFTEPDQVEEKDPAVDIAVMDTSWLELINYGKHFFNVRDMRKGFAQIDKVYAYANASGDSHVHEKASEISRVVGILPKNALCYVIADEAQGWVYMESEYVRGFVNSMFLQQGEEALHYITQVGEENMKTAIPLIAPEENEAYTYSIETVYEVRHGTGEGVIRFADQFVGNPYVWGGYSLTNGVDGSHFVYQILSRCGVYDGDYITSYGWRYIGEEVTSLNDAKAGDVVCYAGHVAIYDGTGGIVEARGRQWGITHNRRADCGEILTIRRLVSDEEESGNNAEIIREYLLNNGFSKAGTAGIMGNIANEACPAFEPSSLELESIGKTGISSDQYTAMVDQGKISKSEFIVSSRFGLYSGGRYGYGLCGFTDPKVKAYAYHYTVEQGKSVGSITGQLDSLLAYLSDNNPDLLSRLKNAKDPEVAAIMFLKEYERCANMPMAEIGRAAAAKSIYESMN